MRLYEILKPVVETVWKIRSRKVLKVSNTVQASYRKDTIVCTLKLTKPYTEYMVYGYVDCSISYDGAMSNALLVSGESEVAGGYVTQTCAQHGGGCVTARYVKTGQGATTLRLVSYGYVDKSYNFRGNIIAVEI